MVIVIVRALMVFGLFLIMAFLAYKIIRRLALTEEKSIQIEEEIIKMNNSILIAEKMGDLVSVESLKKAKAKIINIRKEGKQNESIYRN